MNATTGTKAKLLLGAATRIFYERGFHSAKISDITAEAGVAQGTFYLYFPSKEEIFLELLGRFAADLRQAVLDFSWAELRSVEALTQELHHTLVGIFTTCANQREAASLFFGEAPSVSERAQQIRIQFLLEAEQITAGYLTDGIRIGQARPLDVETVSRAIVGYVLYTLTRTIIDEGRDHDLEGLASELLQFELFGILAERRSE